MPRVTVLLPTYQSERYLKETIDSVLAQTFEDFELLVVDDASTDGTLEILASFQDERIHVVQGPCQGLADALNVGIRQAKGEYIARIDADDLMVPERLEKQVFFMNTHSEVILCGGWQQYFGLSTFLHAPPQSPEQCRANLLFRCDLCHSTLMLRRSVFIANNLFYDSRFAAEDFELWTRALDHGQIANLPEVLGYYREDGRSVTHVKKSKLIAQNGQIVAATLERNLHIRLSAKQKIYFAGWVNPFFQKNGIISAADREGAWADLKDLLLEIWEGNQTVGYYDETALLKTLAAEWAVLRYNLPFDVSSGDISIREVFRKRSYLEILFRKGKSFCGNYRGIRRKYIKLRTVWRTRQETPDREKGEKNT